MPLLKRAEAQRQLHLEMGLAAVVLGSVLAVGSVHVPAALAVAVGSALLGWSVLRRGGLPPTARLPFVIVSALSAYCAIQALPLPRAIVAFLSPKAAEIWTQSLRPLEGPPPGWISLSLDPGASLVEAAKWCGYAGALAVGASLARRRGQLNRIWLWLFVAGLVCAGTALLHRTLGADRLYGIYEPKLAVTPWRVAPLLNPNNLAGYLNFCAFLGFGLLFASRASSVPRPLIGLGLVFILAISILTGSRGALVSLLFGVSLLVGRLALERRSESIPIRARALRYAPLAAVVLGTLLLAGIGGTEQVLSALTQKDLEKLSVTRWALPMIRDYAWLGLGRGAFEAVFPAYRQGGGQLLYQFPENIVTQWLSEWGIVVGSAGIVAFAVVLWPRRLRLSDDIRRHAGHIALLTLLVHNLVDLSLELSGVATSAFTVLGALAGSADRHLEAVPVTPESPKTAALAYAVCGTLFVAAAFVFGRHTAIGDRLALHDAFAAADPKNDHESRQLLARVIEAIRRHPGDPYLPLLAGLITNRVGDNALPWVGLALERDPNRGVPHYWLATLLFNRGQVEQALLHVRLAIARDVTLREEASGPLLDNVQNMDQLMRAVPDGAVGQSFLVALAARVAARPKESITQQALLRAAIERDPRAPRPRVLEGNILADALEKPEQAGSCSGEQRTKCLAQLEKNVALLANTTEFSLPAALLKARFLIVTGRAAQADDFLAGRCPEIQAPAACWRKRVDAAVATADAERIERAMAAYLNVSCTENADCAKASRTMGDILAAREDWLGAVKYYGRAAREAPNRASWARLSRAARNADQPQRAHEAEVRARTAQPELE